MSPVLISDLPSLGCFLFMVGAVISLWFCRSQKFWFIFAAISLFVGFLAHRIDAVGVGSLFALGGVIWLFYQASGLGQVKKLLALVIVFLGLGLGTHQLPGFKNWLILQNFQVSSGAYPIQLYLNFDKPWIGIFLLGLGHSRVHRFSSLWKILKRTFWWDLLACGLILSLSFYLGYVRLDWKWISWSPLWLALNLIFTCVTEEAFFRGFLQRHLSHQWRDWGWGRGLAWWLSSLAFGLAHWSGGWKYVILASGAGLCYGFVYRKTRTIEASIFLHFLVNAIHFVAFTYPALRA